MYPFTDLNLCEKVSGIIVSYIMSYKFWSLILVVIGIFFELRGDNYDDERKEFNKLIGWSFLVVISIVWTYWSIRFNYLGWIMVSLIYDFVGVMTMYELYQRYKKKMAGEIKKEKEE